MYAGRIVETGPIDLFHRVPRHPYSQLLRRSICRLDTDPTLPLAGIDGMPPAPGDIVSGCPFAPRCPSAMSICLETEPRLVPALPDADQLAACHLVAGTHDLVHA